jgi:hypothetical protein
VERGGLDSWRQATWRGGGVSNKRGGKRKGREEENEMKK